MFIKQLYTNCLAQAAYFIESDGEAAVIDPLRDIDAYLELARERKAGIRYILETHFHADFISGHLDLAKATGATIIYGPPAKTSYKIHNAKDGEIIKLGKVKIKALFTPGHSPESTSYLLCDERGKEYALFSGDTLFVGEVGRPDLRGESMTRERLAGLLYDSLHHKIMPLPDDVILYPAHGPGSACGKNIGKETQSTLGQQKKLNYALQKMSREEFVRTIIDGLTTPPAYFAKDFRINQEGYDGLDQLVKRSLAPLDPAAFEREMKKGAMVLDTRTPDEFEQGFVKGSLNIGLNGSFAIWAGTLLDISKPLLLVCAPGKEKETVIRLARVGFDRIAGYLEGGFPAWQQAGKPMDMVISIDADEFNLDLKHDEDIIPVDVRRPSEYDEGHVMHAVNLPLQGMMESLGSLDEIEVDKSEKVYVYCRSGYRSMIASSILKQKGFSNIRNVYGGYLSISETDIPLLRSVSVDSNDESL